MKLSFLSACLVSSSLLLLSACVNTKSGDATADKVTNDSSSVVEEKTTAPSDNIVEIEENDPDNNTTADENDPDEVWNHINGTYIFWSSEEGIGYTVNYLGENEPNTLSVGEDEYDMTISESGEIVACDNSGKEVFRGAIYNRGNVLAGVFKGKKIRIDGLAD